MRAARQSGRGANGAMRHEQDLLRQPEKWRAPMAEPAVKRTADNAQEPSLGNLVSLAVSDWPGVDCQSAYAPLDLIGFNGIANFADIQSKLANANGNAVDPYYKVRIRFGTDSLPSGICGMTCARWALSASSGYNRASATSPSRSSSRS